MKILKIFGFVAGIHVFALILIFANPGCSSSSKPPPSPADTVAHDTTSSINVPTGMSGAMGSSGSSSMPAAPTQDASVFAPAPVTIDPNAPAVATSSSASVFDGNSVRFNPTRPNTPAAGSLVAEPVTDVTPAQTYTVTSGDSLWTIAKKHHLSVAELAAANGLKTNAVLHPGQKLLIPGKPAATNTAATAATPASASPGGSASVRTNATTSASSPRNSTESIKHVVQSGETLSGIAKRYDVRSIDIALANNITDPQRQLRPGMELTIPGWRSPGGSGKSSAAKSGAKATATPANNNVPAATPPAEAAAPKQPEVPVIHIDDSPFTPAPKN